MILARTFALSDGIRWRRIVVVAGSAAILVLAAIEVPLQIQAARNGLGWGPDSDFAFYRNAAKHWLETGSFYLPEQLSGPYQIELNRHIFYPPSALILFVPFALGAPAVLWWAIPLGVVVYALARWRPSYWSWPLLAAILFWPRTQGSILFGNTDIWVAGAVAGGLLWGWPAVLVSLKPTFAPLAIVGLGHRSWWLAWLILGVSVLVTLPLWIDYATTLRNSGVPWSYSLLNAPLALFPVVAWLGSAKASTLAHDLGARTGRTVRLVRRVG